MSDRNRKRILRLRRALRQHPHHKNAQLWKQELQRRIKGNKTTRPVGVSIDVPVIGG